MICLQRWWSAAVCVIWRIFTLLPGTASPATTSLLTFVRRCTLLVRVGLLGAEPPLELPTDRRTYSCLLHPSSCPFSAVPPSFRLPLFFASDVHPCSRGLLGWEVTLEVEVQLAAPNCFFERDWQSDAALDLLFPFDRSLHRWLGAFVRLQGLLEILGPSLGIKGSPCVVLAPLCRRHGRSAPLYPSAALEFPAPGRVW